MAITFVVPRTGLAFAGVGNFLVNPFLGTPHVEYRIRRNDP